MKTYLKAMLVLAVVCAFTSCSKESARPIEAGNPNDSNNDKADTATVTTKKEGGCKLVTVSSRVEEGKTLRYENISESTGLQIRKTSDKGVNSVIDSSGKTTTLENSIAEDGAKTKTREMKFSYVKNLKRLFEKRPANVFYQKDDYATKQTADEGFFFKGKDGEQLKIREIKAITEIEFFDDGVMTKTLSSKVNGKLDPPTAYEYSTSSSKEGEYEVSVETLKAPYTEDGTTTESEVITCKFKSVN